MKDFSKTEAKIRELVPRLKRLSFGCKVFRDKFEGEGVVLEKTGTEDCYTARAAFSGLLGFSSNFIKVLKLRHDDIIGHPITLDDVFEAFFISKVQLECIEYYSRGIRISHYSKENGFIDKFWEYGKPFSEQPEETQQFISDLLSVDV